LIFTETNCYHFDVDEVKTVSDVCGIVTQWRILGSKRTELCRYFDMLFNLYFGSFKKCKAQGVFGEGPKANDNFRNHLKLNSSEWFVFTDRIVDLTTGRDITPDPKQYINVSCGHAGYIHLMAFDGVDSTSNVMMVEEATANIKQFMLDITGGSVEHFEMANYLCKVLSTFLFQGNMEVLLSAW
jgi:hypothetical protein